MSDFDEVLERLLTDPSFQARLAADPVAALAGYVLDAEETDLLSRQVGVDVGAQLAAVEDRVSKSSTFGLFSSFGGLDLTPAEKPVPLGEWSEFGSARQGLGPAPDAWGTGGADMSARSGFGSAPGLDDRGPDLDRLGDGPGGDRLDDQGSGLGRLGDAPRTGFGDAGEARTGLGEPEHLAPPKGYHNRVDADGDGSLDKATYRGREGGGAEIRVDLNDDGKADFVGVDKDLDNRVDFADYDKDHDGVYEKRMFDDDGDGFLDRTVWQ
jgi:hypothetical protein